MILSIVPLVVGLLPVVFFGWPLDDDHFTCVQKSNGFDCSRLAIRKVDNESTSVVIVIGRQLLLFVGHDGNSLSVARK